MFLNGIAWEPALRWIEVMHHKMTKVHGFAQYTIIQRQLIYFLIDYRTHCFPAKDLTALFIFCSITCRIDPCNGDAFFSFIDDMP